MSTSTGYHSRISNPDGGPVHAARPDGLTRCGRRFVAPATHTPDTPVGCGRCRQLAAQKGEAL